MATTTATATTPTSTRQDDKYVYRIAIQPPPGIQAVAPNGFPADPRPKDAPRIFLDAMEIRIKVFCEEQDCDIVPELDEDDPKSWSWVVYRRPLAISDETEEEEEAVSTLRIVPPPHPPHPNEYCDPSEEAYVKLTRVATLVGARKRGLSKWLCEEAFRFLAERPGLVGHGWEGMVLTHAQVDVEDMYVRMGFTTDDKLGRWDEVGIEHLGMWRKLPIERSSRL